MRPHAHTQRRTRTIAHTRTREREREGAEGQTKYINKYQIGSFIYTLLIRFWSNRAKWWVQSQPVTQFVYISCNAVPVTLFSPNSCIILYIGYKTWTWCNNKYTKLFNEFCLFGNDVETNDNSYFEIETRFFLLQYDGMWNLKRWTFLWIKSAYTLTLSRGQTNLVHNNYACWRTRKGHKINVSGTKFDCSMAGLQVLCLLALWNPITSWRQNGTMKCNNIVTSECRLMTMKMTPLVQQASSSLSSVAAASGSLWVQL